MADDQERRARRAVEAGAGWLLAEAAPGEGVGQAVGDALRPLRSPEARARAAAAARALVPANNARAAAIELLRLVLPDDEVDLAEEAVDDALLAAVRDLGAGVADVRAVVDLLDPGREDVRSPEEAAEGVEAATRLLTHARSLGAPRPAALRIAGPLARKLVRATPAQRADAACALLDALAPFDDWAGAAMLLKAFRVEKELGPQRLAAELTAFLDGSGRGRRPLRRDRPAVGRPGDRRRAADQPGDAPGCGGTS